MKLENEKLLLNEEEAKIIRQANMFADEMYAATFLRNSFKNHNLLEKLSEEEQDIKFFVECIRTYRKKNFEII